MVGESQVPPTRSRVSLGQQRLPHYSPRLIFSLGIVQLMCGIALIVLSLLMLRFDRNRVLSWSISLHYLAGVVPDALRVVWLGAWVVLSGLIMLLVSSRASNNCQIYILLLSSLLTVAITGALAILISNHVIQYSVIAAVLTKEPYTLSSVISDEEDVLKQDVHAKQSMRTSDNSQLNQPNPILFFTFLMLCGCLVAFVISIACFSVVSHQLCSCSVLGEKFPAYHIYDTCTWSKKERIAQWVLQQSQLTDPPDSLRPELVLAHGELQRHCSQTPSFSVLLSSSNSTKVSLYAET